MRNGLLHLTSVLLDSRQNSGARINVMTGDRHA